jgi:hypothetical protein
MVTLLLTFFVMLLSLSQKQDAGVVGIGRESFKRSIRGFGLGTFMRKPPRPDFGHVKLKHRLDATEPNPHLRTIAAAENDLWRLFKKVEKYCVITSSETVGGNPDFAVTSISFGAGEWKLNAESTAYVEDFCRELVNSEDSGSRRLYVLGTACEIEDEGQRMLVSARRAQTVAELIKSRLGAQDEWPVYWWGAGDGGQWVADGSPAVKESQILIAVLRPQDGG